jgi:phage-related minor tail protein
LLPYKTLLESLTTAESDALFDKYDQDNSGVINFEEFVGACHAIIISSRSRQPSGQSVADKLEYQFSKSAFQTSNADDDEEEEEVPEEIAALPADQQQSAIKKKAFTMLGIGTFLVLLFSGTHFYCVCVFSNSFI